MNPLVTALILVASAASAVEATVVPHAANLRPEEAEAYAAICAQAYHAAAAEAAPVASAAPGGAAVSVRPELVELSFVGLAWRRGQRVLMSGARRDAEGQLVYEATIEAASLDDAPVACWRLAQALVKKEPVDASQRHGTVTDAEAARRAKRLGATASLGVKTGVTAPLAMNAQLAGMGSLAFDARLEHDRWFYELGLGALIPAFSGLEVFGYGGVSADLGVNYFLVDSEVAPYVGLGVQPRLVFSGAGFNLVPYVQGGLTVTRKSSTRFYVDGRVGQNVLPAVARYYPTELTLNFGVGF